MTIPARSALNQTASVSVWLGTSATGADRCALAVRADRPEERA